MAASTFTSAYLQQLGLDDVVLASPPSVELLNRIYRAHLARFVWSNFRIVVGERLPVHAHEFQQSHMDTLFADGGPCYEQCHLLTQALQDLGFDAYLGSAGVFMPHGGISPDSAHAIVLVRLGGDVYLADAGFAAPPSAVNKLELDTLQEMPCGKKFAMTHWVPEEQEPGSSPLRWVLNAVSPDGALTPVIRFEDRPVLSAEAEGAREWLLQPQCPLRLGWLVKVQRPDFTVLTLACGVWAGSGVPAGQAKFAVKPPASSGAEEVVTLLPAYGEEVVRLLREEFGLKSAVPPRIAAEAQGEAATEAQAEVTGQPASPAEPPVADVQGALPTAEEDDSSPAPRGDLAHSRSAQPSCTLATDPTACTASATEELSGAMAELTTRTTSAAAE